MEAYRVPDTQREHWVSGPVFFLNRTFSAAWNIRCPDTSLKRTVSGPVNVLIFLDTPRIMECRWWTSHFLPFIFNKIPRYGLCYANIYSKRSRNVKILFRRMRWNSMIREVSVFSLARNSMVREISDTKKPLEFHGSWNYRCWNCGKTPWYAKIAARLLYLIRRYFQFPCMILKKVMLPFYSIDTSRYVSWSALHFIAFQGLFCGVVVLYWKWFLTLSTILPFSSRPSLIHFK